MPVKIGHVDALFRYPVKSIGGERLEVALPDLLLFAPHRPEGGVQADLPTHVRTPDGQEMPVFGGDLALEVGRRYGAPVQMMQLNHGIFNEANISVMALDTVREIGRLSRAEPGRATIPTLEILLRNCWRMSSMRTRTTQKLQRGYSHRSTGSRTDHNPRRGANYSGLT